MCFETHHHAFNGYNIEQGDIIYMYEYLWKIQKYFFLTVRGIF